VNRSGGGRLIWIAETNPATTVEGLHRGRLSATADPAATPSEEADHDHCQARRFQLFGLAQPGCARGTLDPADHPGRTGRPVRVAFVDEDGRQLPDEKVDVVHHNGYPNRTDAPS
jgi:hypothetical protein